MKTKLLVQILIIVFIGTVTVQAQEKVERLTRKEIRQVKRDVRKAKKDIKKSMKDIHFDAIHFDGDEFEGIYFDGDIDFDFDFEIPELEALADIEELIEIPEIEGYLRLGEIDELIEIPEIEEYLELAEIPEFVFEAPDIDLRSPKVYSYSKFKSESGSVLALSKDLEDVSITKDFYFDVKEGASSLNMMIEGTLSSGDLTITVNKPSGEKYQEFQVSPLADVDWSQQIELDEEGEVYIGKWTINLSGSGATGNYQLRFRAK